MLSNPEITYELALARLDETLKDAARERLAREAHRAARNFYPGNRLGHTAFWAWVIGPLLGVG